MILSINGKKYLFDASSFSPEDEATIKNISNICTQECLMENIKSEEEIKQRFVYKVASSLERDLSQVKISFVIAVDGAF